MAERSAEVIVVGGGVMGCAAAYHLAKDGRRVLLLEQFALAHDRGSSHGPSRVIRLAYDGADYVHLARASYARWRELEEEQGESLLLTCGGIDFGLPDAHLLAGIRATYEALGVPFEVLDRVEIVRRVPPLNPPEGTIGYYQPDYAMLAADRCVAALAEQARRHGARIVEGERVRTVRPRGDGIEVESDRGTYTAGRLILAAGSWLRPLLRPLALDPPLRVTKEIVAFFRPPDPAPFMPERFPLFLHRFPDTATLGNAFPIYRHPGVKVILDRTGPPVAPDDDDRRPDLSQLLRLRAYAAAILPSLGEEIIESVTCRYTMTPDEHFILDLHPAHPQIVIAAPCSGHGFKFAVVIGRILADLAIDGATSFDIARFRLDRPALKAER